jgi:hypothetical protein
LESVTVGAVKHRNSNTLKMILKPRRKERPKTKGGIWGQAQEDDFNFLP